MRYNILRASAYNDSAVLPAEPRPLLHQPLHRVQSVNFGSWLVHYNRERPHLGYHNQGRRPWETIQRFVTQEG